MENMKRQAEIVTNKIKRAYNKNKNSIDFSRIKFIRNFDNRKFSTLQIF